MSKITRRKFIKSLGAFGAVVVLSNIKYNLGKMSTPLLTEKVGTTYPPAVRGAKFAMMIDVGACIGCRRCQHACKLENNVPDEPGNMHWIDVFEMDNRRPVTEVENIPPIGANIDYTDAPKSDHWYMSFNCFHCEDPPCTKVCPTGATYKDEDGLVLINYDLCIGCRYCMAACPYNARRFNWWNPKLPSVRKSPIDGSLVPINTKVPLRPRGVNEKCTFCVHRIRSGNPVPRCVEVCPVRARHFGNLNDPKSEVSKILVNERTLRIRENLGINPKLYYFTRGVKWTKDGEKI